MARKPKFVPRKGAPQWVKTPEDEKTWLEAIYIRRKNNRNKRNAEAVRREIELYDESFVDAVNRPRAATKEVKATVNEVFERLGGADGLYKFAKANPKEFYLQIWGKLIPRVKEVDVGDNLEELLAELGGGNVPGMLEGPKPVEGEFIIVEQNNE